MHIVQCTLYKHLSSTIIFIIQVMQVTWPPCDMRLIIVLESIQFIFMATRMLYQTACKTLLPHEINEIRDIWPTIVSICSDLNILCNIWDIWPTFISIWSGLDILWNQLSNFSCHGSTTKWTPLIFWNRRIDGRKSWSRNN